MKVKVFFKTAIMLAVLFGLSISANAQLAVYQGIHLTWEATAGTEKKVEISLEGTNACFTGEIYWGDGSYETISYEGTGAYTAYPHTYSAYGTYEVSIVVLEGDYCGDPTATIYGLKCYSSKVSSIKFTGHYGNPLKMLNCGDNQLTALDVSNCEDLKDLYCDANQLTTLDVSECPELKVLGCGGNQLAALDISANTALTGLFCFENQLTSLDVSGSTALKDLYCDANQLTNLDISHNTALTDLRCFENQLTSLDVSGSTALTYLDCSGNQLTNLDISHNTALTKLYCEDNQLSALDISANTALTGLFCFENQLTSLDVSGSTALTNLYCSDNQLTTLDVSHNTALRYLYCSDNQLTTLDVSSNTDLKDLYCGANQLTNLDISHNTALTELKCSDNQLTALDASGCAYLSVLECYDNQLSSLKMNTDDLTWMYCYNNALPLTELYPITQLGGGKYFGTQTLPAQAVSVNGTADFSAQAVIGGTETVFTVAKDGSPATQGTDYGITGGIIMFFTAGIYDIVMTSEAVSSSGYGAEDYPAEVHVQITVGNTGIAETQTGASLQVYPNPTNGQLTITMGHAPLSNIVENVAVYDMTGRNVGANPCGRPMDNETTIDISHLPTGMYFLRVETETGTVTRKVVKQ